MAGGDVIWVRGPGAADEGQASYDHDQDCEDDLPIHGLAFKKRDLVEVGQSCGTTDR